MLLQHLAILVLLTSALHSRVNILIANMELWNSTFHTNILSKVIAVKQTAVFE